MYDVIEDVSVYSIDEPLCIYSKFCNVLCTEQHELANNWHNFIDEHGVIGIQSDQDFWAIVKCHLDLDHIRRHNILASGTASTICASLIFGCHNIYYTNVYFPILIFKNIGKYTVV